MLLTARPSGPARTGTIVRLVGTCVMVAVAALMLAATPASADPSPDAWAALRACESGGNYQVVSRGGTYRGAYQFDLATWRSVGGTGSPEAAAPAEQDYRALILYRMRGWQPWTCARLRGLREDADARSGRMPTRTEAARVGGHSSGAGSTTTSATTWPGHPFVYGDCSPVLRAFQLQMNQRGYHYRFQGTGCYADMTRQAVRAVQTANGLAPRDRLDHATWNAAFTGVAAR